MSFDEAALALIARAAHGSVRDALSLLDQAIAYGGGEVREDVVRTMLGAVDTEYVYRIVDALVANDGPALLAEVDAMAARSVSFASALEDLASLFHRLAVAQAVPAALSSMEDSAADRAARSRGSRPKPCSSPTRSACRAAPICRSRPTRRPDFR